MIADRTNTLDWTIPIGQRLADLRNPAAALLSSREFSADALLELARRAPGAALRSSREFSPEVAAWIRAVAQ